MTVILGVAVVINDRVCRTMSQPATVIQTSSGLLNYTTKMSISALK